MMQRVAEAVSLALTIPTIVLAAAVVLVWFRAARNALWNRCPLTAQEWFVVGVFVGFVGAFFDNLYWLIPWSASFVGAESKRVLVDFGAYVNVVDRQAFGIASAYCHIRAAQEHDVQSWWVQNVRGLFLVSAAVGVIYVAVLWFGVA